MLIDSASEPMEQKTDDVHVEVPNVALHCTRVRSDLGCADSTPCCKFLDKLGVVEVNRVGWSQEKCKFEYTVKVMQTRLQKMHRKSAEFLKLETNRTWLQLIRSCAFLLDSGVPDFWSQTNVQGLPWGY